MLLSLKLLSHFDIQASDGNIGHAKTFLFDEAKWIIRYLVVDTSHWLPGRKVLIAPQAVQTPHAHNRVLPLDLTKDQVKASPEIDTDKPVSRQKETELFEHYNWSSYWGGAVGPVITPGEPVAPITDKEIQQELKAAQEAKESSDPNLRDVNKVIGYKIHAKDGEIGHIKDFIVETENWAIRYMVADTRKLLPGKKVIIPPNWITEISWIDSEVIVDVNKEDVKHSPEYDSSSTIDKDFEKEFYDYHSRPGYWV